jgi:hypothetical protein
MAPVRPQQLSRGLVQLAHCGVCCHIAGRYVPTPSAHGWCQMALYDPGEPIERRGHRPLANTGADPRKPARAATPRRRVAAPRPVVHAVPTVAPGTYPPLRRRADVAVGGLGLLIIVLIALVVYMMIF